MKLAELSEDGFGYFYYKNNYNQILEEDIHFKVFTGLQLVEPYNGT